MFSSIFISVRGLLFVPALILSLTAFPQAAIARGIAPLMSEILQSAGVVITTASRCVSFTYDKNGNRQVQTTSVPPSSAPVWGASRYGCYAWQH